MLNDLWTIFDDLGGFWMIFNLGIYCIVIIFPWFFEDWKILCWPWNIRAVLVRPPEGAEAVVSESAPAQSYPVDCLTFCISAWNQNHMGLQCYNCMQWCYSVLLLLAFVFNFLWTRQLLPRLWPHGSPARRKQHQKLRADWAPESKDSCAWQTANLNCISFLG